MIFSIVQSVHVMGLALLVGTIVLGNLATLGLGPRRDDLSNWTRRGFLVMFVTGPLLFANDVPRYLNNPAFRLKMLFLLFALASHFALPKKSKAAAVLSMALWTCVVIGGRAIADFDI